MNNWIKIGTSLKMSNWGKELNVIFDTQLCQYIEGNIVREDKEVELYGKIFIGNLTDIYKPHRILFEIKKVATVNDLKNFLDIKRYEIIRNTSNYKLMNRVFNIKPIVKCMEDICIHNNGHEQCTKESITLSGWNLHLEKVECIDYEIKK